VARPGPNARPRVGKSKKVVKRRGVGVLVFREEIFLEESRVGALERERRGQDPGRGVWGVGGCRVGISYVSKAGHD